MIAFKHTAQQCTENDLVTAESQLVVTFKLPPLLTETHMEPVVSYEHDDGAVRQTAVLQGS